MRFAGSVYDLLRQASLRDYFKSLSIQDARRRLLARLRFDDLLCCDDPRALSSGRIVVSASDVIEGPLFSFLDPHELKGVAVDICAPSHIALGSEPVARLLRSWIQDEDGFGRPFILNLAPAADERITVAQEISKRRGLDIRSIDDAESVIRETGVSADTCAVVSSHWRKWGEALTMGGGLRLTSFPGRPASAVPLLEQFAAVQESRGGDSKLSAQFGKPIFNEALRRLRSAGGRRDVVVSYFDCIERVTTAVEDIAQLRYVRSIFFRYMFLAVARGNQASDEHSCKVTESDVWALDDEGFDELLPTVPLDSTHRLDLPDRIVSGLADLPSDTYAAVRERHRVDIAVGIGQFLRTKRTEALGRAMERLARDIVSATPSSAGAEDVKRTVVYPHYRIALNVVGAAAVGLGVTAAWNSTVGAAAAKGAYDLTDQAQKLLERKLKPWLLKHSLVAQAELELDGTKE